MRWLAVAAGIGLILWFVWEAFETVVLPRVASRRLRFTRLYYRSLWLLVWKPVARHYRDFRRADNFLGVFGPISLILLLGVWAAILIVGFGLVWWGLAAPLTGASRPPGLGPCVYLSGATFFTLGYGDVTPLTAAGRALAVVEVGLGFAFLGVVIGYLPVIYSAFSRREAVISLLDARAGSPPTALELLRRHATNQSLPDLDHLLKTMESWIASLLEAQLSYSVLCFYRSQHDDQSWMSALVVVMDVCALIMTGLDGVPSWQAQLTFAMGRHALVDLSLVFDQEPAVRYLSRLTPADRSHMETALDKAGIGLVLGAAEAAERMDALRASYEPYAVALARYLEFPLPPFASVHATMDDWQRSAWERPEHFGPRA